MSINRKLVYIMCYYATIKKTEECQISMERYMLCYLIVSMLFKGKMINICIGF